MANSYRIDVASLSDSAAAIEALWVDNLVGHGSGGASAKLRLGYQENPAGSGMALLLYPDGSDSPKGVQGLHPRIFHFGAQRLRAVGFADYAVDPAHRSLGPALMLMRKSIQLAAERYDLVYGLPNQKAAPVLQRAGLRRLGVVRRYAMPLSARDRFAVRMPRWLAALCSPLVDVVLALRERLLTAAELGPLQCMSVEWLDPVFDDLWARRPATLLLSERSGAMLHWRFGMPERGNWKACVARDQAGVARGYVIWRLKQGLAEVGDLFSPEPEAWTASLLMAFSRMARQAGAASASVTFFGRAQVVEQILASGFILRPQLAPLFTLPNGSNDLAAEENWYVTDFDNDAD